jgi:hypothetical protein
MFNHFHTTGSSFKKWQDTIKNDEESSYGVIIQLENALSSFLASTRPISKIQKPEYIFHTCIYLQFKFHYHSAYVEFITLIFPKIGFSHFQLRVATSFFCFRKQPVPLSDSIFRHLSNEYLCCDWNWKFNALGVAENANLPNLPVRQNA